MRATVTDKFHILHHVAQSVLTSREIAVQKINHVISAANFGILVKITQSQIMMAALLPCPAPAWWRARTARWHAPRHSFEPSSVRPAFFDTDSLTSARTATFQQAGIAPHRSLRPGRLQSHEVSLAERMIQRQAT